MNKNAGFTLIEVLIAMIVLAVGLLGLAMLQTTGLSTNQSAYNRSQAVQLASDIVDRMRTNNSLDATGKPYADKYLYAFMKPKDATCATGNTPCTACGSAEKLCTPTQLAVKDLYDWNQALISTLPKGKDDLVATGTITKSGEVYTATILWDENKDGSLDAATDPNFQMKFRL